MIRRAAILLTVLAGATPAAAQRDTMVTVVPGRHYAADRLQQSLLGDDYRPLWLTPIRVPLLDLSGFAGGLTPTKRGGGRQTRSLRFRGADGREYAFRSVDKFPDLADEPALRQTVVADVVQDQVSSLHPGAAAVVAPLVDAAGVLHVTPRLVVMPDDARLGEFRQDFAGVLGWIEERPDETEGGRANFGGFPRITGTEALLDRLEESPDDRVDTRAYLTARLLDLFLNDWDRHEGQWRWAQADRGGRRVWLPIPRDRDYAFVDYDGLVMQIGRNAVKNAVRFGAKIHDVPGLVLNAQALDRRLLTDLDRAVWDSTALVLQARLTDAVIDAAVARMPVELQPLSATQLSAALKGRRDHLPSAARTFYARLASDVEVRGTDARDLAVVDRLRGGEVEVRLYGAEAAGDPYFRRRFRPSETREVRVFLHGGDDRAVLRGEGPAEIGVRLIGGGGDDLLADSSRAGRSAFHDDRGDNRFVRGARTTVDTRTYEAPEAGHSLTGQVARDWGTGSGFEPSVGYRDIDGPIVGGRLTFTRYGFRRYPYARKLAVGGRLGLFSLNAEGSVSGDYHRTASPWGHRFELTGTQLESFRFFGFGNASERLGAKRLYEIRQDQVTAFAGITRALPGDGHLEVGPVLRYTNADVPDASPIGELPRYGNGGFLQAGGLAEAEFDWTDAPVFPRRGARLQLTGSAYPGLWDAEGAFGSLGGVASTYLTADLLVPLTLALRGGGTRAWGEYPVHEAAFLGGSRSVRGYDSQRYAGDAAVFGGAELRAPIDEVELLVRGTLGLLTFADVGRVYFEGDSEGGWHTGVGGGLWFAFRVRDSAFAATGAFAQGESGKFYFTLGAPF